MLVRGTIGIRRFVIDDEDCETLCESYVTHTRVCEKYLTL